MKIFKEKIIKVIHRSAYENIFINKTKIYISTIHTPLEALLKFL